MNFLALHASVVRERLWFGGASLATPGAPPGSTAHKQYAERKSWVGSGSRKRLPSARTGSVGMIRQTRTNRLLKGEGARFLLPAVKDISDRCRSCPVVCASARQT